MRGKKSRITGLADFLNQSVSHPELLADYLTEHECSVVGQLEELKTQVHEQATPSTALVSVIMPTRNTLDQQFSAAIQSVLSQTHQHLELLILDHGGFLLGSDGSIVSDPRVRIIDASHLDGLGAVRQEGLAQARGEFIAWLDDDDLWDRRHLRISLDQIARRGLVAFYSATLATSGQVGKSGLGGRFEYIRWTPFRRALLENRNIIGTPTLVHKNLGPGRLSIPLNRFTDWVTACQLAHEGAIGSLPVILSFYNTQSRHTFVSARKTTAEALAAFRLWQRQRPTPPVQHQVTHQAVTVVVLSGETTDPVDRCVSSLRLAELATGGVELMMVNYSQSATHRGALEAVASSSGLPAMVVDSPKRDIEGAAADGLAHVSELVDVAVIVDARYVLSHGSLASLVDALDTSSGVNAAVPTVVAAPTHPDCGVVGGAQHRDAAVDVTFVPPWGNAVVENALLPEETLLVHSPGVHMMAVVMNQGETVVATDRRATWVSTVTAVCDPV